MTVDGDAMLLHGLEQRGLGFARSTVDLVGQQQIRHDRAGLVDEGIRRFIVHRVADDIGRDSVRGKLDTAGVEAQNLREGQGGGRFADAGDVLHEDVALGQNRH